MKMKNTQTHIEKFQSTQSTMKNIASSWRRYAFAPAFVLGTLILGAGQIPCLAQTTVSATTLRAFKGVRQTQATSTGSTVWVNVPGASATFTVPAFTTDVFLARFTAESVCSGATGWCPVRVLLNGVEMDPVVGTDFAFDSTDGGTANSSSWESHSVERSKSLTSSSVPLNVTLQVQYAVTAAGITFRLDDWHFSIDQLH
jgi:hypothetical protein